MASSTNSENLAAQAVVEHHAQLAAELREQVNQVLVAAEQGDAAQVLKCRDGLADWLHRELVPHAQAEEATLYPAAATQPGGALLVEGMLNEHRLITGLVSELGGAITPVAAAVAARALAAVFATHLAKENDLILPLLVQAPDVSLAGLLDGMHDLIGVDAGPEPGPDGGQHGPHEHGLDRSSDRDEETTTCATTADAESSR